MATGHDMNGVALVELRATVVMLSGDLGEAEIDIYFGKGMGGIKDLFSSMDGDVGAELGEEFGLKLADPLLRVEDERLKLFQIGCDVAFAVGEGLFANVVTGNAARIGVGDLDVVARAFVVADLEVIDTGAAPLALL